MYGVLTEEMRRIDRALPEDHERNYPGFWAAAKDLWDEKQRIRNLDHLEEFMINGDGPNERYQRVMLCQLPDREKRRLTIWSDMGAADLWSLQR